MFFFKNPNSTIDAKYNDETQSHVPLFSPFFRRACDARHRGPRTLGLMILCLSDGTHLLPFLTLSIPSTF